MAGIDDDGILGLPQPATSTMHDHNMVNYNERFFFQNLECNQHLQRDLQNNSDDTGHAWSGELKNIISSMIHERKAAINRGETEFQPEYINEFRRKVKMSLARVQR